VQYCALRFTSAYARQVYELDPKKKLGTSLSKL